MLRVDGLGHGRIPCCFLVPLIDGLGSHSAFIVARLLEGVWDIDDKQSNAASAAKAFAYSRRPSQ